MPNVEQYGSGSVEPEPREHLNRHFGQLDAREYVVLSTSLATYAHDEGIGSIVLVDKAARPAYIGLLHSWRAFYPDEPRPLICFMNPLGMQPSKQLAPLARVKGIHETITAGLQPPDTPRSEDAIAADFERTFTELSRRKELPLLVVDTCLHSGESVRPVQERLRASGYSDVRLGVADYNPCGRTPSVIPDVVFGSEDSDGNCYPFGYRDRLVTKTFDGVTSRPSRHPVHQQEGRELRAEARAIITKGLRSSGYVAMDD